MLKDRAAHDIGAFEVNDDFAVRASLGFVVFKRRAGKENGDLIRRDVVAYLIDESDAVAIAVPRDAYRVCPTPHDATQAGEVGCARAIRGAVGEPSVGDAGYAGDVEAQAPEDCRRQ